MAVVKKIYNLFFTVYVYFYVLLYIGYILFIIFALSSYSVISVSATLLPYIFLLFMILISWNRSDTKNNRGEKKNLINLAVVSTIPFLICLVLLGINENKTSFTTEKWEGNMSERVYIVDDLIDTYELNGKSISEIEDLLGPPTETEYFKTENNIVYYLGYERGIISIDSEWLVIELDNSQTVKNYAVLTD